MTLMCRAIEEGFLALRRERVQGLPRNLRVLHLWLPDAFAIRYWWRTMRSPIGESSFAAHARHAQPEIRALADAVLDRICEAPRPRLISGACWKSPQAPRASRKDGNCCIAFQRGVIPASGLERDRDSSGFALAPNGVRGGTSPSGSDMDVSAAH